MNTENLFINETNAFEILGDLNVEDSNMMFNNSYNEKAIVEKINSLSKEAQIELQIVAAHVAVIGVGNNNYGSIKINDKQIDVMSIIRKNNIKINTLDAKLKEDELSVRRLVRIYRYHIKNFLHKNDKSSYLYRKYSDHNERFKSICFPGSEHMIETQEEINYMRQVYSKMSDATGGSFLERFNRIISARGLNKN